MENSQRLTGIEIVLQRRDEIFRQIVVARVADVHVLQIPQRTVQAIQGTGRLIEGIAGPVYWTAVMGAQQRQAYGFTRRLGEQISNQQHVADGLGHFLLVHIDEAHVHPVTAEELAIVGAGTLGNLVLVVGKHQVAATAVNIDGLAQMFFYHAGAFQVPTRAASAPGALPARNIHWRRLPKHEVGGIAFVRRDLYASAFDNVGAILPGQASVFCVGRHAEQYVAIGFVGVTLFDQCHDHRDHLSDVFGGAGFDRR